MTDMAQPATEPQARKRTRGRKPMPARGSIRTKGVVTIPQEIRQQVDLHEGDEVIFTVEDGKVVVTPAAVIPRDQAWFWTPAWQAKEAEAEADLASGRFVRHTTDDDFLTSLDED